MAESGPGNQFPGPERATFWQFSDPQSAKNGSFPGPESTNPVLVTLPNSEQTTQLGGESDKGVFSSWPGMGYFLESANISSFSGPELAPVPDRTVSAKREFFFNISDACLHSKEKATLNTNNNFMRIVIMCRSIFRIILFILWKTVCFSNSNLRSQEQLLLCFLQSWLFHQNIIHTMNTNHRIVSTLLTGWYHYRSL